MYNEASPIYRNYSNGEQGETETEERCDKTVSEALRGISMQDDLPEKGAGEKGIIWVKVW